ncbi:MarR family winged helix-turn-helix transcriptional regulator [Romboutsia lituseburensis]|uniref:MarR family winged helix-turn-helix transcriptional regulator n=1 Tax=Romboutsia lituseburensis TaxID=1537 RepID=UPI00215A2F2D|nr:MarR family transcriptional regulator [Romboutsia lituseburensis]MCR8746777.1 MarR family transcriptional regulator [Romboutsia lituseburensis]
MDSNDILDLIRNIALFRKNYTTFIGKNLIDLEITNSEFSYLKEVINFNGIPQDELIRNLSIDKAAATRMAQSLEKKDLIKRVRNENNKRFFNVFLTKKGTEYIDITNKILTDFYNISFKNTNDNSFEELKHILKQINKDFI